MIQLIKSFLRFLGVDRAVFYCNVTQLLRLITGPITMVLVLRYLTPAVQGYFYTFSGIVAMQVFLEMGFSQNILQFASHEFSKLHFTPEKTLDGDPEALSRIISLGRLACGYYTAAALLMMFFIGIGGHLFFTFSGSHGVNWQGAWWIIVIGASLSLAVNPAWSLLEGCNRVVDIAKFRLWNTVIVFLASAGAFILGAGIYVPAVTTLAGLLVSASYILLFWRRFLCQFLNPPQHGKISWLHEIWPFQWRIAVSWMSGYFIFNIVNPVAFYFCGAAEAGRFGMSFQLVRMISGIAMSWVNTKTPRFGMMIAVRQWKELNGLWRRSTIQACSICVLGVVLFLTALPTVGHFLPVLLKRLAPTSVNVWLGCAVISQVLLCSMAAELRAYKKEPYMGISVWNAVLSILFILPLAKYWGIDGVAIGYSLAAWAIIYPAVQIFRHKRPEYRRDMECHAASTETKPALSTPSL